jgi:hypothetical protein
MAARLPDYNTLVSAGINPKTGEPIRLVDREASKGSIKKFLRLIDEQDAVNRYT